ncbi:CheR methyltransferase, SAM binding protein, partial [human gut metagenome]
MKAVSNSDLSKYFDIRDDKYYVNSKIKDKVTFS